MQRALITEVSQFRLVETADANHSPDGTRSGLNFLRSSNPAGVTRTDDRPLLFSIQTNP